MQNLRCLVETQEEVLSELLALQECSVKKRSGLEMQLVQEQNVLVS
jgi:hypothetical protein